MHLASTWLTVPYLDVYAVVLRKKILLLGFLYLQVRGKTFSKSCTSKLIYIAVADTFEVRAVIKASSHLPT